MTVAAAQPFRRTQARPVRIGRRSRGTVMILVVALLGILFVAGAAFLQTVTFQARMVDEDQNEREAAGVLDAVDALVFEQLTRSWLDGEGAAYVPPPDDPTTPNVDESRAVVRQPTSGNTPYFTQLPTYGEALGLHPILSTTEPIDNLSLRTIPTDLNRVLRGYEQPSREDLTEWSTLIGQARMSWKGGANYVDFLSPPVADLFDADGDGVVDSVEAILDPSNPVAPEQAGLIPRAQQLPVVEQLRASDAPLDDNRLRLSLRVVSHGSMINATCTHPLLINNVVNDWIDPPEAAKFNIGTYLAYAPAAYRPEIEERALRYRNILPARSLASSALETELSGFRVVAPDASMLYAYAPAGGIGGTLGSHRWWPFDSQYEVSSGLRYGILFNAEPTFSISYNVADAMAYDRRHLVTTVSYDDLLIRGLRFPIDPALGNKSGRDIVEWMRSSDMRGQPVLRYRDNYPDTLRGGSLNDEYTLGLFGDDMDRRVGRLQLSIPELDKFLVDHGGVGTTIDNFRSNLSPQDQAHFVGMIYDTFWLMLWTHPDLDRNGTYEPWNPGNPTQTDDWERIRLAASLTANFIDYADSDDQPTYIPLVDNDGQLVDVDNNGTPGDYGVFGLERQPYISEVYTKVVDDGNSRVAASSVYAIELYNPYDVPINLTGYELTDHGTAALTLLTEAGLPLDRMTDIPLGSIGTGVILPREFQVYFGYGSKPASVQDPLTLSGSDDIAFDENSEICLVRVVDIGGTTYKIDVDRVEPGIETKSYARTGLGSPDPLGTLGEALSVQRDTSTDGSVAQNPLWRVVVPRVTLLADSATGGQADAIHTLEQNNAARTETIDPAIRPVQIEVANSGLLSSAYPTTGSLLLLMRLAHEYDASQSPPGSTPCNHVRSVRVTGVPGLWADHDQIDNGRMPVFDVGVRTASPVGSGAYYHTAPSSTSLGKAQGLAALPWGQFVFDYFTALPLQRTWDAQVDYQQPSVDQGGLRVHGRIDINAAPWKLLAGLPLHRLIDFPVPLQGKLAGPYSRASWDVSGQIALQSSPMPIGPELARAIVAYREAREIPGGCSSGFGGSTCSFSFAERARDLTSGVARTDYLAGLRQGRGFLTVGELANVRHIGDAGNAAHPVTRIDYGSVGRFDINTGFPTEDYVEAVALLVGLEEWVTTRSHVFTIYGTLRGPDNGTASSVAEADAKGIRFEETVNRLPTFFDDKAALDRIGERLVGRYEEARAD